MRTYWVCWVLVVAVVGCTGSSVVGGPPDAAVGTDVGAVTDLGDTSLDAGRDATVDVTVDAGENIDSDIAEDTSGDASGDAVADTAGDVPSRCMSGSDCVGNPGGPACDTSTGQCVPCTVTDDRCAVGQYCTGTTCVSGCRNDQACAVAVGSDAGVGGDGGVGPSRRCDMNSRMCVDCLGDTDCPAGTLCVGAVCVTGCSATHRCPATQECCDGACVDTLGNTAHCGGCGAHCEVAHGSAACLNGVCTVGVCATPFADCDADRTNGCETDTFTSVMHCGGCGMACTARSNATATCSAGRCQYACEMGFADCDGNPANGCEVDTRSDVTHCGGCETSCSPPNATPSCAMSRCSVAACATGFGDCDANPTNGCETRLNTEVSHCGTCGNACTAGANAFPGCLGGRCVSSCLTGFLDCDGDPSNGCESELRSDALNCGACGRRCVLSHATGSCQMAQCQVTTCDDGFADCDGDPSNGCEANLRSDVANCRACGTVCSVMGGTPACTMGVCGVAACATGRGDCDANPGNGCETDLNGDPSSCGACGSVCALPNATARCTSGRCTVGVCNTGFADCDGNAANGCETDTRSTVTACGACGNRCSLANATAGCTGGVCTIAACNTGFADCDGSAANGCETDIRSTVTACGACGNRCAVSNATAVCTGGVCAVGVCNPGFADCDRSAANGCEVSTGSDPRNCGRCGGACSLNNVSVAGCSAGACTVGACATGFADCDRVAANGCEVDTRSDPGHCGGCGVRCATGVCREGACQSFGGAFEVSDPACGARCFNGNFYGGGCACPGGFGSTVTVRTINDCAGRGTQIGAVITFCAGPAAGDYGGVFQQDDPVGGGGGCRARNQFTGGCSCPSGYAGAGFRTLVDRVDGGGGLIGSHFTVCTRSGSPRPSFGGAYQVDDAVPGGVGCRTANTVTGGCSCPAGTSARALRVEVDSSAGIIGSQVFVCVR